MRNIRLIARLDVKAPNLVKGIQLEGLRKLGDPNEFALKYYGQGIDEIYYEDIVASLYERNTLLEIIGKDHGKYFRSYYSRWWTADYRGRLCSSEGGCGQGGREYCSNKTAQYYF